jgi:hypothetical protein
MLPGVGTTAKVALARALEDSQEGDVVFIVRLRGDDAHATSSEFRTRDLCWAASILDWHRIAQIGKD